LAISELYVRLVEQEQAGGPAIRAFAAEPDCWLSYRGLAGERQVLRPDALVRLAIPPVEVSWFVEIDRGTERLATIAGKCRAYARYEASGQEQRRHGVFPGVAFLVPDEHRAIQLQRVIRRQPPSVQPLFVVATTDAALTALAEPEVSA